MIISDFCFKTGHNPDSILNWQESQARGAVDELVVFFTDGSVRSYNVTVGAYGKQYIIIGDRGYKMALVALSAPHNWKEDAMTKLISCVECRELLGFRNKSGDCGPAVQRLEMERDRKNAEMAQAYRKAKQEKDAEEMLTDEARRRYQENEQRYSYREKYEVAYRDTPLEVYKTTDGIPDNPILGRVVPTAVFTAEELEEIDKNTAAIKQGLIGEGEIK